MTIKEACDKTGLTRKAIRYYEAAGLISPETDLNGYRNYSDELIKRLNLIAMLRGFRLSVEEIRNSIDEEQSLTEALRRKINELQREKNLLSMESELLKEFLEGERSLDEISKLRKKTEASLRDRRGYLAEKLRQLFPGDLGSLLAAVYGKMLDQSLETEEQMAAWKSMVEEFDELGPVKIPDDIAEWARKRVDADYIEDNLERLQKEYSLDYVEFSGNKIKDVNKYLQDEDLRKELREASERAKKISAFLSGPGLQVSIILGKYLPTLSDFFANFSEKAPLFNQEHPELLKSLDL